MSDVFEIVLATIVVLAVGIPFVIAFEKARKEMDESEDE